jgi:hypothetical protein
MGMKQDTLFEHKESIIACEETMVDAKEYQKLLEPLKKQKTTLKTLWTERMCDFCYKPWYLKEQSLEPRKSKPQIKGHKRSFGE